MYLDSCMQTERIVSACDAVSASLRTGKAAVLVRHPLARIGLQACGGLELEKGVFVGHSGDKAWAVICQ